MSLMTDALYKVRFTGNRVEFEEDTGVWDGYGSEYIKIRKYNLGDYVDYNPETCFLPEFCHAKVDSALGSIVRITVEALEICDPIVEATDGKYALKILDHGIAFSTPDKRYITSNSNCRILTKHNQIVPYNSKVFSFPNDVTVDVKFRDGKVLVTSGFNLVTKEFDTSVVNKMVVRLFGVSYQKGSIDVAKLVLSILQKRTPYEITESSVDRIIESYFIEESTDEYKSKFTMSGDFRFMLCTFFGYNFITYYNNSRTPIAGVKWADNIEKYIAYDAKGKDIVAEYESLLLPEGMFNSDLYYRINLGTMFKDLPGSLIGGCASAAECNQYIESLKNSHFN